MDVYARTLVAMLLGRYGPVDVVVDVQNGMPFFTRLATRKPVVVLLHHVHREQWPVVYPGLLGRVGWWIESRLSPRLYRRSRYVTVSEATRAELIDLGVDRERIEVVHNGNAPTALLPGRAADEPRLCVLGRLVPHKQVEHAIDALAELSEKHPALKLDVVGSGWWEGELRDHAARLGVTERVTFHGFVDDAVKHEILARAWVMAMPSIKEGWGLVVGEAGSQRTPTVAYRSAGGTNESIDHKDSGVLVDTREEMIETIGEILDRHDWREFLSDGALRKSREFSWKTSQAGFAAIVTGDSSP